MWEYPVPINKKTDMQVKKNKKQLTMEEYILNQIAINEENKYQIITKISKYVKNNYKIIHTLAMKLFLKSIN